MMNKTGLYLAGGGARGAYQAGVLQGIDEILSTRSSPFSMITGVSVGGINAATLAEHADNFATGVEKLNNLWSTIHCDKIFNANNYDFGRSILRNFSQSLLKGTEPGSLLNTAPLNKIIENNINFERIKENIVDGKLETLEIIAHCYNTQQTVSFYQHTHKNFNDWSYPRHISERTDIRKEHIIASSSLPLFFQTVNINDLIYGDGSMGLISPLRGMLRFDINKVLIIGTRHTAGTVSLPSDLNTNIGLAQILGNMLNGLFLDTLDRDIEMVNRMNDIAGLLSLWKKRKSPWRCVKTLYIRPSIDLSQIAKENFNNMPQLLRLTLNMMGAKKNSGDLLSFLLFDSIFANKIMNLGYHDAIAAANDILDFFK
jgi:NTE family protein